MTSSNYIFAADASTVSFNTPTAFGWYVGGSTQLLGLGSTAMESFVPAIFWAGTVASPSLSQAAAVSDVATNTLLIQAQGAYSLASTHKTGGGLDLLSGAGKVSATDAPGKVRLVLGSNAAVYADGFDFTDVGGHTGAHIGWFDAGLVNPTNGAMWFGTSAISPSGANYAFLSNGSSYVIFNTPTATGSTMYFRLGGSTDELTINSLGLNVSTLAGFGTGIVAVDNAGHLSFTASIGAAVVAPGVAGQVFYTNATPAAAWTSLVSIDTTHGVFTAGGSGSDFKAAMGPLTGHETTDAAFWLLANATARSANNYTFESDGTSSIWNVGAAGIHYFYEANSTLRMRLSSNAIIIDSLPELFWTAVNISPLIVQQGAGSDVATYDLTARAQAPGVGATVHRYPGDFVVDIPTPLGATDFQGGFTISKNGTKRITMGWYAGPDTTYDGIWFGGARGLSDFGFLGNATQTFLNGASIVYILISGTTGQGISVSGAAPNTAVIAGSAITSLTFGTQVALGATSLQGGQGVTGLVVSAPANATGTATTRVIGALETTRRDSGGSFTIDTTLTDTEVNVTATQDITLPAQNASIARRIWLWIDATGGAIVFNLIRHAAEKINGTAATWGPVTFEAGTVGRLALDGDGTNWRVGS